MGFTKHVDKLLAEQSTSNVVKRKSETEAVDKLQTSVRQVCSSSIEFSPQGKCVLGSST